MIPDVLCALICYAPYWTFCTCLLCSLIYVVHFFVMLPDVLCAVVCYTPRNVVCFKIVRISYTLIHISSKILTNYMFPGSVWPPYPGANQGFWARNAGFYNTLPNFSTNSRSSPSFSPTSRLYKTTTRTPTIRTPTFSTSAPLRSGSPQGLPTLFSPYKVLLRRQQVP